MSAPETPKKKKKKKPSFAGYTISTSFESDMDGVYGIAYCPICGDREESQHDHGCEEQQAINVSVGKIRTHMTLVHKLKEDVDA
jgi:hypothetical protein